MDSKISVFRIPKREVVEQLESLSFPKFENSYDFLTRMPISSFTNEELNKLQQKHDELKIELNTLLKKNSLDLWLEDIHNIQISI